MIGFVGAMPLSTSPVFISGFPGKQLCQDGASRRGAMSSVRASAADSTSQPRSARRRRGQIDIPDYTLQHVSERGLVHAPRQARSGSSRKTRGHVRAQGRRYRSREFAPPPPGLRVAAGSARGRKLASPTVHLRPMMSKVREAVFSMLYMMDALHPDGTALDLFCGSGSVGIEAISRGMKGAVFVDMAQDCVQTVQANLETCGFADKGLTICNRVENSLQMATNMNGGKHYDLITVTPPYEEVNYGDLLSQIAKSDCVGEGTFLVVEYPVELKTLPPALEGRLIGLRNRRYGRTVIAVYACQPHQELEARPDEFVSLW